MRSQYSNSQKIEEKSRLFLKSICLDLGWKFRDYDQDNDIDGEIEVFKEKEKKEKLINETKAEFVKIQLKATENIVISNENIIFQSPIKLMHFADVCEQPVVLIIYDVKDNKAYWLWLQEYMYRVLDVENPNWRNNTSSVSIKISRNNIVTSDGNFSNSLEDISKTGIFEINQLRKKNTIEHYYNVIKEEDVSIAQWRRHSLKVLVEKSFSESKNAMEILIKHLVKKNNESNYFRNNIVKSLHSEHLDILWIFLYNDIRQEKDGLPFARAEWNNPSKQIDMSILSELSESINITEDIKVQWNDYPDYHLEERMSKGEYFELFDDVYERFSEIVNILRETYTLFLEKEISLDQLIEKCLDYAEEIKRHSEKCNCIEKLPPYECSDLDDKLICLINHLENIEIYVSNNKRDPKNKVWGIKSSLEGAEESHADLKYELKKVRY